MKTFRFSFRGRDRFIDAENIFDAMVNFRALHEGANIQELLITELS